MKCLSEDDYYMYMYSGVMCIFSQQGDIIYVLRRVDENWCEGRLNGKLGIFPVSFVEVSNAVVCEKTLDYCNLQQELTLIKET